MGKSSYRNLHVDGVDYKYVIGKLKVKISKPTGIEVVDKREVSVSGKGTGLVTTPGIVARYIQGRDFTAEDFFDSCGHEGRELRINPYKAEINEKIVYQVLCKDCYYKIADDI